MVNPNTVFMATALCPVKALKPDSAKAETMARRHGPREGIPAGCKVKALKGRNPMGVTGMK
jgi:hypothetical protein